MNKSLEHELWAVMVDQIQQFQNRHGVIDVLAFGIHLSSDLLSLDVGPHIWERLAWELASAIPLVGLRQATMNFFIRRRSEGGFEVRFQVSGDVGAYPEELRIWLVHWMALELSRNMALGARLVQLYASQTLDSLGSPSRDIRVRFNATYRGGPVVSSLALLERSLTKVERRTQFPWFESEYSYQDRSRLADAVSRAPSH